MVAPQMQAEDTKKGGMGASTPYTLVVFPSSILIQSPIPTHTSSCQEKPVEHVRQLPTSSARTQLSTQNFTGRLTPKTTRLAT